MTLRITDISFKDFRSYEAFELHNLGDLTILVGPNAVGKTNVIEGIQLLTALTSFRHATIDQLMKRGCSSAYLSYSCTDGNRLLDMSLSMSDHQKRYQLNGKAKRPSDLRGLVPSVTFTPDDLNLVKGSMSARRQAIDTLGSQLNSNYHLIRKDYEKVLRHKNHLLKEDAPDMMMDSINEMLVMCGAQLTCYRLALFEKILPYMKVGYERIAGNGEEFGGWIVPSWERSEGVPSLSSSPSPPPKLTLTREEARTQLERALEQVGAEERARHRCLAGPHLDEVYFSINGMNATLFGSQGQQRSVVLSYKLAEAQVIEEMLAQKPVVLLDDVMSELDSMRRAALVEYVLKGAQTFVTTANLAYFDERMLSEARVVNLPM